MGYTFKGLKFNFKYSPIVLLKAQKIATEFGLSIETLGGLSGLVLMAAACDTPNQVLELNNEDLEALQNELEDNAEFKVYMKDAAYQPKKKKSQVKK